jgi:uncharacterized membrane protein YccC
MPSAEQASLHLQEVQPKSIAQLVAEYDRAQEILHNALDAHLTALQKGNEEAKTSALDILDKACNELDRAADELNLF